MFVNKIGMQHLAYGKNCQDYGLELDNFKLVCDGCSESEHSEVGAKAYCHLAELGHGTEQIFAELIPVFGQSTALIKKYLCFTILEAVEREEAFGLSYCGDGYIILEDAAGNISFEELSNGAYPRYFAYNYCDAASLRFYKDGVKMEHKTFSKKNYKRIGVASDGLRYLVKSEDERLKAEFTELLKTGKAVKIKRFINRNQKVFQDDITIVF